MKKPIRSSVKLSFWMKLQLLKNTHKLEIMISFIISTALLIIGIFYTFKEGFGCGMIWGAFALLAFLCVFLYAFFYRAQKTSNKAIVIERDKRTGKWEYEPRRITGELAWNRKKNYWKTGNDIRISVQDRINAILISDNKGWARIYGNSVERVAEIGLWKGKDYQIFHMVDGQWADSVIPVDGEEAKILINNFGECFPVKKGWIVDEHQIYKFLKKLYELQDIETVMKYFAFEDSTMMIRELKSIRKYIVPTGEIIDEDVEKRTKWLNYLEDNSRTALQIMSKNNYT